MSLSPLNVDQCFSILKYLLRKINEHADLEEYAVVMLRIKKFKKGLTRKA
jgi:hypothetical protein